MSFPIFMLIHEDVDEWDALININHIRTLSESEGANPRTSIEMDDGSIYVVKGGVKEWHCKIMREIRNAY